MKKTLAIWALLAAALSPQALLAAPTDADAARAAAEAKARAAWNDKVTAYKLCVAQDRVAAHYREQMAANGKSAPEPVTTPPCMEPEPFTFNAEGTQPREGSGAHSPAETAQRPPSSSTPENGEKPLAK
ncbi:hypothetical protein [Bordetella sp. 02P26C-1]|uniref:hypothetical protein n=1 Tax=Bordetella sp. 02P26C-1 TaxID=2683195 RepID=UPI001352B558|nr:hypothetical protein [Bordetella sp. 02P26C-1]MVW78531.1 hypothetical protein [Bordetella sp. 02P26C-1]